MSIEVSGVSAASIETPLVRVHTEAAATSLDFSRVYTEWFHVVQRWCRSLGGPSADVEDLVQEVFVVVQRKLSRFEGDYLAAWLYRITLRTVRDQRRRSWFRRVVLGREEETKDVEDEGASSFTLLEQKQTRARFYRIVASMNRKWRDTFVLFEVVGHSGDEIAVLTGLPAATVRTHLHRARKEFLALVAAEVES
jgi:RNA polymerase sigma-70 factor (ECF subfamily)